MIHLATRHNTGSELFIGWYRESDNTGNSLPLSKFLKREPITYLLGAVPWTEFLTPKYHYHEFAVVPEDYDIYNAYEDYPEAFI